MYRPLQIVALTLVAVAMALSLAHALELPGKMRLGKETYLEVQKVYYPGFTVGGAAEPVGILALLTLLALTPFGGGRFWWTLAALLALTAAHAVYWLVTHPVNTVWTRDIPLTGFGAAFFSLFTGDLPRDWSKLRDTWEYSHVARSVLAMLSFIFLAIAATAPGAAARTG
jgi:hypothetical protein